MPAHADQHFHLVRSRLRRIPQRPVVHPPRVSHHRRDLELSPPHRHANTRRHSVVRRVGVQVCSRPEGRPRFDERIHLPPVKPVLRHQRQLIGDHRRGRHGVQNPVRLYERNRQVQFPVQRVAFHREASAQPVLQRQPHHVISRLGIGCEGLRHAGIDRFKRVGHRAAAGKAHRHRLSATRKNKEAENPITKQHPPADRMPRTRSPGKEIQRMQEKQASSPPHRPLRHSAVTNFLPNHFIHLPLKPARPHATLESGGPGPPLDPGRPSYIYGNRKNKSRPTVSTHTSLRSGVGTQEPRPGRLLAKYPLRSEKPQRHGCGK